VKLSKQEHNKHGYEITDHHCIGGALVFGILWLCDGIHSIAWDTAEQAENHAENNYRFMR
jgi:hypothetical protein